MFAVRIHGRGGQGAVTAAELLSVAAFDEGRHAQAFPTFGSERTGAPVVAFCRIDDLPIRLRDPVADPDAVIVQDPTLLHHVDLFGVLDPVDFLILNSSRASPTWARRPARPRPHPSSPRPPPTSPGGCSADRCRTPRSWVPSPP